MSLGGGLHWKMIREQATNALAQSHFVTTFVDLYPYGQWNHFKVDSGLTGAERARVIESQMSKELNNPRFLPYLSVYEVEALVFTDLSQLAAVLDEASLLQFKKLQKSVGNALPEEINNRRDTSPNHRLRKIPKYSKLLTLPQVLERTGIESITAQCPHFCDWIKALENL